MVLFPVVLSSQCFTLFFFPFLFVLANAAPPYGSFLFFLYSGPIFHTGLDFAHKEPTFSNLRQSFFMVFFPWKSLPSKSSSVFIERTGQLVSFRVFQSYNFKRQRPSLNQVFVFSMNLGAPPSFVFSPGCRNNLRAAMWVSDVRLNGDGSMLSSSVLPSGPF